jgi:hypothetical protein
MAISSATRQSLIEKIRHQARYDRNQPWDIIANLLEDDGRKIEQLEAQVKKLTPVHKRESVPPPV